MQCCSYTYYSGNDMFILNWKMTGKKECKISCVKNYELNFMTMKNVFALTRYLFSIVLLECHVHGKSSFVRAPRSAWMHIYDHIFKTNFHSKRNAMFSHIIFSIILSIYFHLLFVRTLYIFFLKKNLNPILIDGIFHWQWKFEWAEMNHVSNMEWVLLFIFN